MSNDLKPVRCGCGGEAKVYETPLKDCEGYFVQCNDCRTATFIWLSEAEAVEAWNTAMNERTTKAKVNFKDENYFFGWCECGQYQSSQFPYCPACGARLEWK